jgi:pyruvate formate lyase activating enzyme
MAENKIICEICPHHCALTEGMTGICKGRSCKEGKIVCSNYGMLTSIALDPIEKKPLKHFFPRSKILSVGSYGCNLHCPFCQNSEISMMSFSDGPNAGKSLESCNEELPCYKFTPEVLVAKAKELEKQDNIGIAYTYNEPLISYEFVLIAQNLQRQMGLKMFL